MKPAETIDAYIATFPPKVRAVLRKIRRVVRTAAPGATETISYRIPAFKGNGILVYFAAFKNHIGFFPPVRGDARLEKALAPYAGEKGNLRFPLDRPIPYELIERITKLRVKQDAVKAKSSRGKKPAEKRMQKATTQGPDEYVASLDGWRLELVTMLRAGARSVAALDEVVKWGHLVYSANGPVLLIRAEDERVLFGFWRGQRLRDVEPRLKPGGMYEMATIELREGMTIKPATARRLAREAVTLNREIGDPTKDAKRKPVRKKRS